MSIYSKEELQMYKEAFLVVKDKALTCPELLSWGVCYNADEYLMGLGQKEANVCSVYVYEAINVLAKYWLHARKFTGSDQLFAYFVPDDCKYGKWEGPNLEMRLDLLDYLIAKCDELLDLEE